MSKKRLADNYLTHDNWDEDEETLEAKTGEFAKASEEVIKSRNIKKARRQTALDTSSTGGVNPFQSFSFNTNYNTQPDKTTQSPFSFNKTNSAAPLFSNNTTTSFSTFANKTTTSFPSLSTSTPTQSSFNAPATTSTTQQLSNTASKILPPLSNKVTFTKNETSETSTFKEEICRLNEEVIEWLKTHFEENPFCVFTPIFDDYKKYVDELGGQKELIGDGEEDDGEDGGGSGGGEKEECAEVSSKKSDKVDEDVSKPELSIKKLPSTTITTTETPATTNTPSTSTAPSFSFSKADDTKSTPFTFGFKPSGQISTFGSKAAEQPSLFGSKSTEQPSLFGSKPSEQPSLFGSKPSMFGSTSFSSVGNTAPSMFSEGFFNKPPAATATTSAASVAGEEEGGEYVPPKAESVENKEEGAFYSVKCKLYYKIEDKFEDRGVGYLHLKPNNNKTQLIIRTDTALGNILLNINVEKSMPIARQGGNNVTLVCIPNPPLDPSNPSSKPICTLIRVKGKSDADELHKHLVECQEKI